MSVTLGNASISEFGTINGEKGDQTGREVCLRLWYDGSWTDCLRPTDPDLAEKIASAMEAACANDCIGYGQSDRLTLNDQAKKVGYDLAKITTRCNCDCSSLIAVCVIAGGVKVSPSIYTGNEAQALLNTGRFERMAGTEYLTDEKKLKRGDILIRKYHHTVMVLSDGEEALPEPDDGKRYIDTDELNVREFASMAGLPKAAIECGSEVEILAQEGDWARIRLEGFVAAAYLSKAQPKATYTTTDNLNLREDPGTEAKILLTIPTGSTVKATGDTEKIGSTMWREVSYGGKLGWCSGDYLA